jgi:hypothetical protein
MSEPLPVMPATLKPLKSPFAGENPMLYRRFEN